MSFNWLQNSLSSLLIILFGLIILFIALGPKMKKAAPVIGIRIIKKLELFPTRVFALSFTNPTSASLSIMFIWKLCVLCKPKASTQCVGPLPVLTDLWWRSGHSVPENSKLDERTQLMQNHHHHTRNNLDEQNDVLAVSDFTDEM